jgi:uncharacterized protein YjeT (DUF2065 family)
MSGSSETPRDLVAQAQSLRHRDGSGRGQESEGSRRLFGRIYLALLLFVVLAGLPMLAVPSLRHRLASRVRTLREAALSGGRAVQPAMAMVGENTEPFPKEYEIPLTIWAKPPAPYTIRMPVFRSAPASAGAEETGDPSGSPGSEETGAGEAVPEFRQGAVEKQAYDLLLASSETLAGMVQGRDQALRFVRWSAARREGDTYWVDLTFATVPNNSEARFIFQVDLASKKVIPLSALARSLAAK